MNDRPDRKPENFDWVRARAACSLFQFFEKLKLQIEEDVKARNAISPQQPQYKFSIVNAGNNGFSVLIEGTSEWNRIHDSVRFTISNDKISVFTIGGLMFDATVTLCDDGECRARIGGQEYDSWQLRKKALEELFFKAY
jgi:hypothetical protein